MPRVIDGKTGRVTDYNVTPRRTPGGLGGTAKDAAGYVARNVSDIQTPGGLSGVSGVGIVEGEPRMVPDGFGGFTWEYPPNALTPIAAGAKPVGRNLITGDIVYDDGSVYAGDGTQIAPPGTAEPVGIFDSITRTLADPANDTLLGMVKRYGPPLLTAYALLKLFGLIKEAR